MKELFFKPEDFMGGFSVHDSKDIAAMSNRKLSALIESMPVVYGHEGSTYWRPVEDSARPTHKARLAFIEEIVKEPELCKCCGQEMKK